MTTKAIVTNQQNKEPVSSHMVTFGAAPHAPYIYGGHSLPRAAGNLATQRLLASDRVIQPKLAVSQPGDPQEEEADRIAEKILHSSSTAITVQRKCSSCPEGAPCPKCEEEKMVQRKAQSLSNATVESGVGIQSSSGPGHPLPFSLRAFFEQHFDNDFGAVRVHSDAAAAESARTINAKAFTMGTNIIFGEGQYSPNTTEGRRLLAHELTHVLQQRSTLAAPKLVQRQAAAPAPAAQPAPGPEGGKESPPKIKIPDPKGELILHTPTKVTFSDNVEYVRFQLETFLADKGLARLGSFDSGLYIYDPGIPFVQNKKPSQDPEYLKKVMLLVQSEVRKIKSQIEDFRNDFQRRGVDTTWAVLDSSKAEVEKEKERYGIKAEAKTFLGIKYGTKYTMEETKGTSDLVKAANLLLEKHKVYTAALDEFSQYEPPGKPPSPYRDPEQAALVELQRQAAQAKLEAAEKEYNEVRFEKEAEHPILATYGLDAHLPGTSSMLATIASGTSESRAAALGSEIMEKLENIETARKDVGEDNTLIWKLPTIVQATKQLPDIQGDPRLSMLLKSTVISEKVGEVTANEEILKMVLGAVLIGLAVLAAIPTGGLSLAGATVVAGAGVASGALSVALAIRAFNEYQFQAAASGTSFDKAKALSQEEPSLFWLALDIVGAIFDASAAIKAFRRILEIRKVAIAAKTVGNVGEAEQALRQLEKLGDDVKAGSGKRLRQEAEGVGATLARDAEEIEKNIGKARPSSVEGYVEEIPLGENNYWRRTSNGIWCRFSSPPRCLIPPGTVPVQVPTPTGGAAAEVSRIAAAGYQKLPNGFKALDAISGGKMELISEEGKIITQYSGAKGISMKYTSITDAVSLKSKINTDLRDLFQFTDYTLENVRVKSLGSKHLDLIFEEGLVNSIDKSTRAMLAEIAADAKSRLKITFNWFVYSGGQRFSGPKFFEEQEKVLKGL